ncbi:hematopoietic cell signal transducer isoform 1-T2 [Menidia menidia]
MNRAMAYHTLTVAVLIFLSNLSVTLADGTVTCYRIEAGTMAGIICADVVLTLVIVIVTYRCARSRRLKIDNAEKVYMNVRANLKST